MLSLHWHAHHLEVVGLSAFPTSFVIGRALSLGVSCSAVLKIFHAPVFYMCFIVLSLYTSFDWVKSPWPLLCLSNASFCNLFASTLWAHDSTNLLVASLVSSCSDTSLKISLIIPSSSSPCVNCSVTFCHTPYSHILLLLSTICTSTTWADSWLFLISLWHCSDSTILYWCGLYLWLSTEESFCSLVFQLFFICECFYE